MKWWEKSLQHLEVDQVSVINKTECLGKNEKICGSEQTLKTWVLENPMKSDNAIVIVHFVELFQRFKKPLSLCHTIFSIDSFSFKQHAVLKLQNNKTAIQKKILNIVSQYLSVFLFSL